MMTSYISSGADETRAIGKELGERLRPGDLVTLHGELGAGKTTFVGGVARAFDVPEAVTSPTFVLIIEHEGQVPLLHLDAYRLESLCYDAIRDAGVADFLDRDDAVKLVEWPERIADFLPIPRFSVSLEAGENENERRITIEENTGHSSGRE